MVQRVELKLRLSGEEAKVLSSGEAAAMISKADFLSEFNAFEEAYRLKAKTLHMHWAKRPQRNAETAAKLQPLGHTSCDEIAAQRAMNTFAKDRHNSRRK